MKIKGIIAILLLSLCWFSCSNEHISPDEPETSNRTVLVYMLANNNLNRYAYTNLKSMVEGYTSNKLDKENLMVYLASSTGSSALIDIKSDETVFTSDFDIYTYLSNHTVKQYNYSNSADPQTMQEIIADVKTHAPSPSYGLILWSHGTGWLSSDYKIQLRSFGPDGSNYLEIDELAAGLPDQLFDFIMFDACYMASIECVYELRNKADYILSSPTETMGDGWPYAQIIPCFFTPEAQLQTAASIFYNYYNAQSGAMQTATVSLVKTAMLNEVMQQTKAILSDKTSTDIYNVDRSQLQRMDYLSGSPGLLYDYDDYIKALATDEQYIQFQSALQAAVVYEAHTETAFFGSPQRSYPIDRSCGLTVYVPQQRYPAMNAWYESRISWSKAVYPY